MSKCILLFSGGLDSIISYYVLKDAGAERVLALIFSSPFFSPEKAVEAAKTNGIEYEIIEIFSEYLEILKTPKYGYGKNLNPCIDCKGLMINIAVSYAEKNKYDFVASGEVLGQRPMSQTKNGFEKMSKILKREEMLLRPLSAKLLNETEMEKTLLVNREKLLSISGRERKEQVLLAEKYRIKKIPSPAGGCLLTYKEYSKKAKMLLSKNLCKERFFFMIKMGRVIEYEKGIAILGRSAEDNENLLQFKEKKYWISDKKGPLGIIIGELSSAERDDFLEKILVYSKREIYEKNLIDVF